MKNYLIIFIALLLCTACKKQFSAPVPTDNWALFDSSKAVGLSIATRGKLEGIYVISNGSGAFGDTAAIKWSYTANGTDTTYHLSMFCEKQVGYIICEGKRLDTNILLSGYWRKMVNTETGTVRLTISQKNGANHLFTTTAFNALQDSILISGVFTGNSLGGEQPIGLKYVRPLYKGNPLDIVAHRGGGRTSDLLPASENSAEIIQLAPRFGATGVEVDVRLTSDGVPILLHDKSLNERVTQRNGLYGDVDNFTYAQLNSLVRLKQGERIPTLREALTTFLYKTPLDFIWLDTKFNGPMQVVRDLQKEFLAKANAIGRNVVIAIGIPDEDVLHNFLLLPDHRAAISVCELSPSDVKNANAKFWGPRWTLGTQNDEVDKMHADGRKAYVWTLDVPENIYDFMAKGRFDGILTNYPSIAAYYYYVRK